MWGRSQAAQFIPVATKEKASDYPVQDEID